MDQNWNWPDLSPCETSGLEWWFIQGNFKCDQKGQRDFMLSLFRQTSKQDGNVHMALLSTLDPATGNHIARSQVSPKFVDNFLSEAPGQLNKWGISERFAETFLDELIESGPPAPIFVEHSLPEVTAVPFVASWGDIQLRQDGNKITIGFDLSGDECQFFLETKSDCQWFCEEGVGGRGGVGAMAYQSCPRLELSGTVDNLPVKGKAWFDHQWGDFGWFRGDEDQALLLGWNWFGINLLNGTDLLVLVHRNMRSGQALAASTIVFQGGKQQTVNDVTITATRCWLSPETMISYPVEWDIKIPSISATLKFSPTVDDQEIPVYGLIGAIWEGAGSISGKIAGKAVSGRARLELQGYGYIHDFKAYQDRWIEKIDDNIRTFFPQQLDQNQLSSYLGPPRWKYDAIAHTEMLSRPAWDLLVRGGKHWRPIFGILLLKALGTDSEPFELALSVIPELQHNASVIIDDIEDSSLTRRGDQTIHVKYGIPTAISTANTLYFLPMLSIFNNEHLSTDQKEAIYRMLVEMFIQAHFGQAQDLHWSKLDAADRLEAWHDEDIGELILQTHAFKTAAPVRATAELSCIFANADKETLVACKRFAESEGVAFQIVDDVNNFSKSEESGKECGEDISSGKFSFAIHKAVQLLEGSNQRRLTEILSCEKLRRTDEGMNEAIILIRGSGALEACRQFAQELVDEDWPAFSRVLPASRHKLMLRVLLAKLIDLPVNSRAGPGPPVSDG